MILKAIGLGLSSGLFCAGFCYPVLIPFMFSDEASTWKKSVANLSFFICGRLVAYTLFGIFVGLLAEYLRDLWFLHNVIIPFIFILLGSIMAIHGFSNLFKRYKACRVFNRLFNKSRSLFIVGFLAGINICPPFLLAVSVALRSGSLTKSVIFFLIFFLTTTIFVTPLIFSHLISKFEDARFCAKIISVFVGSWFIYLGLSQIV